MTLLDANVVSNVGPNIVAGVLLSVLVILGATSMVYGKKKNQINDNINKIVNKGRIK